MKKSRLFKESGDTEMIISEIVALVTEYKDPEKLFAIIMTESAGNELAQSYCARGLTQMTKAALLDVEKITKEKWYYDDLFDPVIAVKAGSIYFNMLLSKFKQDETLAVLAYSWGIGNVLKWLKSPADNSKIDESIPQDKKDYIWNYTYWKYFYRANFLHLKL